MFNLSNTEYTILSLIREVEKASGYRLNTVIENRGYREWADIGMTSIYAALKKLEQKGLVQGKLTTDKATRGPAAKEYNLTAEGTRLLKEETVKGLSQTRERDRRFDLALSTMDLLSSLEALACIKERIAFLIKEQKRLAAIYDNQRYGISFMGALLFKHTLHILQGEIAFLKKLLDNWEKETTDDHRQF